jgi:hypothetical protein
MAPPRFKGCWGGAVRSVQGVVQSTQPRFTGNVDPDRIAVEGCSRTDRGSPRPLHDCANIPPGLNKPGFLPTVFDTREIFTRAMLLIRS